MDRINFEMMFPYMNDIFYDDVDFVERVDNQRKSIYYRESRFLEQEGETYAWDTWNALPNGRFGVTYEDWRFECLFHRKKGPLYVILNGALIGKKPEFKRWSYYNFLQGSMLNIADPMYYRFKDLRLGWYYGDENHNLREYLSKVIIKVARMLGLANEDIIIIGSSGGGSAAIQTGALIPGSTVIAINAQIKLSLYYYHEKFTRITGIELSGEDCLGRNDLLYCLKNENKLPTQYILLNNIKSEVDRDQINHILSGIPIRLKYGISQWNSLTVWLYDAILNGKSGAHGAQEYHQIFFTIIFLVECVSRKVPLADYENLYLLFSEFWNDHFELIDRGRQFEAMANRAVTLLNLNMSAVVLENCEKILDIKNKNVVSAQNEMYKHIVISDHLKEDSLYCLCIKTIVCKEKTEKQFTILIREMNEKCIYCRKEVEFGNDIVYCFKTSKETDNLELRLYCGRPAHTGNKEIYIEGLKLVRLTI